MSKLDHGHEYPPKLSFETMTIYEEERDHIHTCLYQIWVYREIMRRTGHWDAGDDLGWNWGDPDYFGQDPFTMYSDQVATGLAIIGIPLSVVEYRHCYLEMEAEDERDKMRPEGETVQDQLTEEDLMFCFEADDEETMLLWKRRFGERMNVPPSANGFIGVYEFWEQIPQPLDPPKTLAEQFEKQDEKPCFYVIIRDAMWEIGDYAYETLFKFCDAWREVNAKAHAKGRSRRSYGRRNRRGPRGSTGSVRARGKANT